MDRDTAHLVLRQAMALYIEGITPWAPRVERGDMAAAQAVFDADSRVLQQAADAAGDLLDDYGRSRLGHAHPGLTFSGGNST